MRSAGGAWRDAGVCVYRLRDGGCCGDCGGADAVDPGAGGAGVAIDCESESTAKLEGQSIRDGLTGLFNRNFMEIALERELHRAVRKGMPLAVLMLDVDHFKQLNDTMGHEAGDVVLREVAECYRRALRDEDVICRYGGEEFVVIMPDATEAIALERAERVRTAVSEIRMHFRGELIRSVTVSVGVAMFPEAGRDGSELLRLADGALYRAKNSGRNQVMLESAGGV